MLGSARRPKKARRNSGERSAGSSTYPITVHRRTLEAEVPEKERKGRVGTVDFPCGESILLLLLLLRFCHLSAGDCTRCCCNSSNPSSRYGTFFSTASPLLLALMSFVLPPQTPTPSSIILLSFCLLPCVDLARRDGQRGCRCICVMKNLS